MNKLEEYRDHLSEGQDNYSKEYPHSFAFQAGFDAAIALDLPVKFYNWKAKLDSETALNVGNKKGMAEVKREYWDKINQYFDNEGEPIRIEGLYKYWLDNIYNPEL